MLLTKRRIRRTVFWLTYMKRTTHSLILYRVHSNLQLSLLPLLIRWWYIGILSCMNFFFWRQTLTKRQMADWFGCVCLRILTVIQKWKLTDMVIDIHTHYQATIAFSISKNYILEEEKHAWGFLFMYKNQCRASLQAYKYQKQLGMGQYKCNISSQEPRQRRNGNKERSNQGMHYNEQLFFFWIFLNFIRMKNEKEKSRKRNGCITPKKNGIVQRV